MSSLQKEIFLWKKPPKRWIWATALPRRYIEDSESATYQGTAQLAPMGQKQRTFKLHKDSANQFQLYAWSQVTPSRIFPKLTVNDVWYWTTADDFVYFNIKILYYW